MALKLAKLGSAAGGKALRNAATVAMTPVVKAAKAAAPVGTKAHKTYKGRLVAPGFLSRNVKKKTYLWKNGLGVSAWVGMSKEAWYGGLIETGWRPGGRSKAVKSASRKVRGGLSGSALDGLGDRRSKITGEPWLEPAFLKTKDQVLTRFKDKLRENIKKAAR